MMLLRMKPVKVLIIYFILILFPLTLPLLTSLEFFDAVRYSTWCSVTFGLVYVFCLSYALNKKVEAMGMAQSFFVQPLCIGYCFCYAPVFIFMSLRFKALLPFHLMAMACMGYVLFQCFHAFITINRNERLGWKETMREIWKTVKKNNGNHFLFFEIQRKINKTFEN